MAAPIKTKYDLRTPEEKEKIVLEYINGSVGYPMVAESHGLRREVLWRWIKAYRQNGIEGLRPKSRRPHVKKIKTKTGSEVERLKRQLARKEIEIERLKKGYAVKGDNKKKEYVTTFDRNSK